MPRFMFLAFCLLVVLAPIAEASSDSDNDGYPDWMEVLCGTNPYRPDTPTREQVINAVVQKVAEYFSSPPEQRQAIIEQVVQLVIAYFNLPSEELLISETVTYSGGSVSTQNIALTIPPGAFPSNTEVKIYEMYENPFGDNTISDGYKIELSQLPSKPVEIKVKYSGEPSGEMLIAVGEGTFIKSIGEETKTYLFLPATTLDGYAVAELPPQEISGLSTSSIKSKSNGYSFNIWVLAGYSKYETQHFRIYFPSSLAYSDSIERLGDALENAHNTYKNMGFGYSARTEWPMVVVVKKLGTGVYGYYSDSIWGMNSGRMEMNSEKINEIDEMRITAGHEFFHFVQSLYDPRNSISKAKGWFYTHYWLDEACAVWAEEKFAQPNYISTVRAGNEYAPFNGMHAGSEGDAKGHGYGMSALIKYLVKKHGEGILVEIYNQIKAGKHPVEAIENVVGDSSDWYADFLEDYVLGKIYSDFYPLGYLSGSYTVSSNNAHKSFVNSYPDLSGKLFLIRLDNPEMSENAEMKIRQNSVDGYITVFKVKSNSIQYLDEGYNEVTISNLKDLQDNGWNLLVLVTNTRAIYPYTEEEEIEIEVSVTSFEKWKGTWSGTFCWKLGSSLDCWNEHGSWEASVNGTSAIITLYDDAGDVIGSGSGVWGDTITISANTDLMYNPITITGSRITSTTVQGSWSVYDPDGSYATGTWSGSLQ